MRSNLTDETAALQLHAAVSQSLKLFSLIFEICRSESEIVLGLIKRGQSSRLSINDSAPLERVGHVCAR